MANKKRHRFVMGSADCPDCLTDKHRSNRVRHLKHSNHERSEDQREWITCTLTAHVTGHCPCTVRTAQTSVRGQRSLSVPIATNGLIMRLFGDFMAWHEVCPIHLESFKTSLTENRHEIRNPDAQQPVRQLRGYLRNDPRRHVGLSSRKVAQTFTHTASTANTCHHVFDRSFIRVSSAIQLISHVLPLSAEKACSKWTASALRGSITNRTTIGLPSQTSLS